MPPTEARRRVGLIVDHPSRDLPGMVLLAFELAGRGVETALIPLYDQGVDVPLLGLDALVLNFARQVNEPLAREYARLGIRLYVLDTEGGILSDKGRVSPDAIAAYVRDSGFAGLLQGYLFWGAALRDAFAAAGTLPAERMHLTGCPRFDYYSAAFPALEPPRRQGHVLVNTNFPVVNPRFAADPTGDAEALRSVGFEDHYIAQLQIENRKVMQGMTELVARLAADLPERAFVLRPHPFEREEAYREALGHLPNVTVDAAGPVLEALRGAHALVHLNCGTAVEALMLGIAPLSPEWLNSDFMRAHSALPGRASRPLHSYEELRALLASERPGEGFDMAATYRATAHTFFHDSDAGAAARVADVLVRDLDGAPAAAKRALGTSLRGSHAAPSLGQRLQGLAANLIGSAAVRDLRARLRPGRRAKRFGADDVGRSLESLARAFARPAPAVSAARHPLFGARLSSLIVLPNQGSAAR